MKSLKFTLNLLNRLKTISLILFFFMAIHLLNAQWSKYPSVNNPVCAESDEQLSPEIISDGAGGTIVTWYDKRSTSEYDIYAQRLDAMGVAQWTTDGVLICNVSGDQVLPVICQDGSGGAFIAWIDAGTNGDAIYAQQIDDAGDLQWSTDGVLICSPGTDNKNLRIVYDNSGAAIIVWEDYRNSTADIYAQRIGSSGTVEWQSDGVEICTEVGDQRTPMLAMDYDNNNAIITWDDSRKSKKGKIFDIYAQKVDLSGNVQWTANGIEICIAVNDQLMPGIVSDDSGGAIITWHDIRGSNYDIYAQRVDSSGAVLWVTDGLAICSATGNQLNSQIITDGAFGAIISWVDSRTTGAMHIYSQRITYAGNVLWTTNGVVICSSSGDRKIPKIISDYSGGAILVWSDFRNSSHYDLYAQTINSTGQIQWAANGNLICSASGDQLNYSIVGDDFGGACIAWNDARGKSIDIYSQNILKDGGLGIVPEINVKGNNLSILDNDVTPTISDNSDFGSVISLTPITRSFMLFNTGNEELTITNIYTSGTQKSEFVPQSMKFPFKIVAHDSLLVDVTFKPVSVGISNAVLNIDNNDSNESVFNYAIRATFKAAEIDVKGNNTSIVDGDMTPDFSDSTDFGQIRLNKSLTRIFTIINSGTDTLKINNINISGANSSEFTFPTIQYPRKLGPGKSLFVPLTFLPKATGTRTAMMNIASNDPNESAYDFAIKGVSVTPLILVKGNNRTIADGDVTPITEDFTDYSKVNISVQKSSVFKIFNTGTEILSISDIYMTGTNIADFVLPTLTFPQTINTGDSLSLTVTFSGVDIGIRSAVLNIDNDDDSRTIYNITLKATAISQEINVKGNGISILTGDNSPVSSDFTLFGNVNRNSSKTNRFYIVNTGTDILMVSGISISGADASIFSPGALFPASPIPAGDSSYFDLSFNPASNGLKNAIVTISNNDADEGSYGFAVQGLSVSPKIQVEGNQIIINDGNVDVSTGNNTDFGSVELSNSILKSFKIFNTGNDILIINSVAMTGANATEYAIQGLTFPHNIAPGENVSFDINFTPLAEGIRTAAVNINSNDVDITVYDFNLQGTATKKLSLFSNSVSTNLFFYPNPANSELTLVLPASYVSAHIRILSTDGKTLWYQVIRKVQNTFLVDVSDLDVGVYMVNIELDGVMVNKKLLINR